MEVTSVYVNRNERSPPFEAMARDVLGASYELSLVVCGDTLAQRMNKNIATNPTPQRPHSRLKKKSGEIFLNVRSAEREARKYNVAPPTHGVAFRTRIISSQRSLARSTHGKCRTKDSDQI
jgi:hypothetical protein